MVSLALLLGTIALAGCEGSDSSTGALMAPGQDCLRCHSFTVAGTVFDVSGGGAEGVIVVVDGVTLTSNAAGNFFTTSSISFPASVEILRQKRVATMPSPAPDGGCNRCHGASQPPITAP
jgi:hypothetical protein